MSIPINPFELANFLISKHYRIPIPVDASLMFKNSAENFISLSDSNVVNLGDLLEHLRIHIIKLTKENMELKKDLKTVTTNGSVQWVVNEYYENKNGFDESVAIHAKWFLNEAKLK